MRETELVMLDHDLAQGPCLVRDAVFGACVGAVIGWFGKADSKHLFSSIAQGAVAGTGVSLASYAFGSWKSANEHRQLGVPSSHLTGALAPYPFYAPSVTYSWSNH